ncbi:hypothetical protein ACVWXO_008061 [Bradyrhizobium sp. LM2.7]
MTTAQESVHGIKIAYGLLWLMSIDTRTKNGLLAHTARKQLLELLTRADQAEGITAARALLGNRDPGAPHPDALTGRPEYLPPDPPTEPRP